MGGEAAIIVEGQRTTVIASLSPPKSRFCQNLMQPPKYPLVIARLLLLTLLTIAPAGCGQHSQFASQLATPTGPIAVVAKVDGSGDITTALNGNKPNVTFHFGGNRQVVIHQDRILVDDEVYPPAPAGTKVIDINVQNGKVTLTADGQPITKQ